MGRSKKKITEIQTQTTTTIIKKTKSPKSKTTPTKRARKTYDKAGQKKDTPGEMNGAFIFYDSLYKEKPKSQMAEIWLMEHGCFDNDKQLKLAKKYKRTQSPKKEAPKKRKRKVESDDEDSEPKK